MRKLFVATLAAGAILTAGIAYAAVTSTTSIVDMSVTFANGASLSVTSSVPLGSADFTAMAEYMTKQATALAPSPAPAPTPTK